VALGKGKKEMLGEGGEKLENSVSGQSQKSVPNLKIPTLEKFLPISKGEESG
jgi:hypothetical protein